GLPVVCAPERNRDRRDLLYASRSQRNKTKLARAASWTRYHKAREPACAQPSESPPDCPGVYLKFRDTQLTFSIGRAPAPPYNRACRSSGAILEAARFDLARFIPTH